MKLLLDRNITLANDLEVIKLVYGSENHELRASEIAEYMSLTHHGPINLQVADLANGLFKNRCSTSAT